VEPPAPVAAKGNEQPAQQQLPIPELLSHSTTPQQRAKPAGANMQLLTTLASALGLGAEADATAIQAAVDKTIKERNDAIAQRNAMLQAAAVATVEEAIGSITAGLAAVDQCRVLTKCVEGLEHDATERERAEIIARIKRDGKCWPVQEVSLFPTLSLDALRTFEKTAPRVRVPGPTEPTRNGDGSPTEAPTWNSKTFAQLKPMERAELRDQNRELYDAMRSHAKATGAL